MRSLNGSRLSYACDEMVLRRLETGATQDGCFDNVDLEAGEYELQVTASQGAELPYHYAFHVSGSHAPESFGPVTVGGEAIVLDSAMGGGIGRSEGGQNYHEVEVDVTEVGVLSARLECVAVTEYRCSTSVAIRRDPSGPWTDAPAVDVTPGRYVVRVNSLNGPIDYRLTMEVAEGDSRVLAIGQLVRPSPGSDEGVITSGDLRDRYTFEVAGAGARLNIGLLPAFPQLTSSPYDPSGEWVCKSWVLKNAYGTRHNACLFDDWLDGGPTRSTSSPRRRSRCPTSTGSS